MSTSGQTTRLADRLKAASEQREVIAVPSITLFQMNDLHAQLLPHAELFWQAGKAVYRRDIGGAARIAGIVKAERQRRPETVMFLDCGDALFGSYYPTVDQGRGMVKVLNAMGIDATNGGHWEFAFGPAVYRQRAAELNYPVYACNICDQANGNLIFPAAGIHEVGGLKIGIIGLASNIVDKGMPPNFSTGLRFGNGLEEGRLPAAVAQLRPQVDLLLTVSHLGLAQDIEVAKRVPEIDVFVSGHTHNRLWQPYVLRHEGGRPGGTVAGSERASAAGAGRQTLFVQAGFSGSFLGQLDLTVEDGRLTDYRWRLRVVDASCPTDEATQAAVAEVAGPHRSYLAEVVGHTATPLHRMLFLESTMDNLITQAYQAYTGAQVAISHGWRYGPPVALAADGGPGPVTCNDLWSMVPLDVPVFTLELTGQELRDLTEQWMAGAATAPIDQKGGYFTRQVGMNVMARINNPDGYRVEELFIAGKPYDPELPYRVVVGGQQDVRGAGSNRRQLDSSALDILRWYLGRSSPVQADLTHDKFVWI
ncbi:MAG: bifunctional metallophosphatase/5'-nucleotidase [Symbiobacteriia bacterium]